MTTSRCAFESPFKASINKGTHVGQPVFSVLFALLSLAGDSPPASKRTKIPRKSKAVRCEAVLPEQKCSQTRKRPQRILCVFSRALTPYEGISARQNRVCPCQSTQTMTAYVAGHCRSDRQTCPLVRVYTQHNTAIILFSIGATEVIAI